MKKYYVTFAFLLHALLSLSVYALEISDFTQTEYAFNLNESDALPIAPNSLEGEREKLFDFINFEMHEPNERWVAYLDTAERDLNKKFLIIRIRQNLNKPKSSKITVKLRAVSPDKFGKLIDYRKAEIDIVNGKKAYSVSWDVKYNPDKLDVHNINIDYVIKRIKKKSPAAWAVIERLMGEYSDQLQQTIVMRALKWEGVVTDIPGHVKAEYQIWSPYYRRPEVFFSSIAFKGKTEDENLRVVADRINKALTINGIAVPADEAVSKTAATFRLSAGFNH